jgi:hypothetical protein
VIGLTGAGILERKGCLSFALSDVPEEERKGRIENSAIADRGIRSIVARPAQGNDRPTANIIDVSPCPFGPLKKLVPPIPDA